MATSLHIQKLKKSSPSPINIKCLKAEVTKDLDLQLKIILEINALKLT